MSLDLPALICLVMAAVPSGLFLLNLAVYRRLPPVESAGEGAEPGISVLIPARNEEANLPATLASITANPGDHIEILVLDDHSTDRTAEIVTEFSARDPRVRLHAAPPLPPGWCGKQHACHTLAGLATRPLLVFLDADVRLGPDALRRMSAFLNRSRLSLASGVPRQETKTFSERLLLPLIHFVLLGFLPMHAMRRTRWAAMSAGCGQLFVVRRDHYLASGGHAMLRDSLHDGLKLPRAFRRAGFWTGLFDATDVATCRMYQSNRETWRGLGKNATEGLAAPGTIGPMSVLLVGGQVLPFLLLWLNLSGSAWSMAAMACILALLPRLLGAWLFRQDLLSALLHPIGIVALLSIQWWALFRKLLGRPAEWKGRSYGAVPTVQTPGTA